VATRYLLEPPPVQRTLTHLSESRDLARMPVLPAPQSWSNHYSVKRDLLQCQKRPAPPSWSDHFQSGPLTTVAPPLKSCSVTPQHPPNPPTSLSFSSFGANAKVTVSPTLKGSVGSALDLSSTTSFKALALYHHSLPLGVLTLKGVVLPSSIATTPISPGLRGPEPAQTKQVSKRDPLQGQKRPTICGLWSTHSSARFETDTRLLRTCQRRHVLRSLLSLRLCSQRSFSPLFSWWAEEQAEEEEACRVMNHRQRQGPKPGTRTRVLRRPKSVKRDLL
jgi:hypothetical protein